MIKNVLIIFAILGKFLGKINFFFLQTYDMWHVNYNNAKVVWMDIQSSQ